MRESYGVHTVPVDRGIFSGWLFVLLMGIISYGGVYCGAIADPSRWVSVLGYMLCPSLP
jgi:hypothetical protein